MYRLLLNNFEVVGVGWGAFWLRQLEYLHQQWEQLLPLLEAGTLDPGAGCCYPLERASAALRELDERRAIGRSSSKFAKPLASKTSVSCHRGVFWPGPTIKAR
jgi:NADPH:quinone reductase-like Zn-dependent oxidoreductase